MASSLASTLITRALDNLSRAAAGTTRSGADMNTKGIEWLNSSMLFMSRKHDFIECKSTSSGVTGTSVTVANTKTYTFPSGWKSIYDVILLDGTNSRKLRMKLWPKYVRETPYPAVDSTGTPVYYSPYTNSFDVNPVPDAVYSMPIHYAIWPTTITVITASCIYETDKDDVLVSGMTYKGFMYTTSSNNSDSSRPYSIVYRHSIYCIRYRIDIEAIGIGRVVDRCPCTIPCRIWSLSNILRP